MSMDLSVCRCRQRRDTRKEKRRQGETRLESQESEPLWVEAVRDEEGGVPTLEGVLLVGEESVERARVERES